MLELRSIKIRHFSLVGKNYRELRDFYNGLLDLSLDFDDKENKYCQFDLGGGIKIDFESEKAVQKELPNLKEKIGLLVRIEVEDVDKVYEEMKNQKELLGKPMSREWGVRSFYLLDPVKNLIEIYQKT